MQDINAAWAEKCESARSPQHSALILCQHLQTEALSAVCASYFQHFHEVKTVSVICDGIRIGKPAKEFLCTALQDLDDNTPAMMPPVDSIFNKEGKKMLCFPPKVFIHPIPLIPSQALICVPSWFQALICVPPWFQALKMSRHFFLESPFF